MGAASPNSEFLSEAREHLATVCDLLLNLERSSGQDAVDRVDRLLRAIHSIKGGAGFLGHKAIQRVAHSAESVLESVRDGRLPVDGQLVDALLAAVDLLNALLDDLDHSDDWDIAPILERLEALAGPRESRSGPPPTSPLPAEPESASPADTQAPDAAVSEPPIPRRCDLVIDLSASSRDSGMDLLAIVEQLASLGELVEGELETFATELGALQGEPTLWWHTGVVTAAATRAVRQLCEAAGWTLRAEVTAPSGIPALAEPAVAVGADALQVAPPASIRGAAAPSTSSRSAELTGVPAVAAPIAAVATAPATPFTPTIDRGGTLRISVDLVDRLMNLAGELVLTRNQTRRYADQNQPIPNSVVQRLSAVTSAFQDVILQTRMQPVGQLFNKFPRLVRDLARQLGKQIELKMVGTEVELDKSILDAMSDPLTHLVRNSCDHGIEPPDIRQSQGKPPQGTITLTAQHLGDQIAIEVADDGAGVDRQRVKQQALKQGLRTADQLARMEDHELLGLILLPGFSTAANVTDVSGRGVGMDVVKTSIEQQSGHLGISSPPGQGTTFTLRLPLTLAIIPCLMVRAQGQRYALPQKDLEELVFVHAGQTRVRIERTSDQQFARLRGRLLPLVSLTDVLNHPEAWTESNRQRILGGNAEASDNESRLFAVVRAGRHRYALVVDQVESSDEIVVKPLHGSLRHLPIYAGATILGDGTVSLILDCEGIARHAQLRFGDDAQAVEPAGTRATTAQLPVLLCRNTSPEPLAIPLPMIRRIVMVHQQQVESLGGERFVTIDGTPTRLVKVEDAIGSGATTDRPILFALLPRDAQLPATLVVEQILDTDAIQPDLHHPTAAAPGVLGLTVLRDRSTLVLDLNRLLAPAARSARVAAGRHERILLVEDTQFFRDLVGGFLREAGYAVTITENGQEALDRLRHEAFDLVVSDLEMPQCDGWTLAATVRRDPALAGLPLLALTTLSGTAQRDRALAHGFDQFLVKVERDELLAAVEGLLRGTAARQSMRGASHG